MPAIERFLASQSTLLQMKFDLLAAYRTHLLAQQLCDRSLVGSSTSDAVNVAMSYWEAQLEYRWKAFHSHADRHLPVIATVNEFLHPLYKTARDLERALQRSSSENTTAVADIGSPVLATSPMSRKRRRFSGSRATAGGGGGVAARAVMGQGGGWHDSKIARVQRQLELNSQVADVAKKAELWRALAFAVSSAAVVSIEEMIEVTTRA